MRDDYKNVISSTHAEDIIIEAQNHMQGCKEDHKYFLFGKCSAKFLVAKRTSEELYPYLIGEKLKIGSQDIPNTNLVLVFIP